MTDRTENRFRTEPWSGLTPPYRTIVADPPWPVYYGRRDNAGLPYTTMPLDEITALPVADLADRSAHLYLWTVTAYLRDAFTVVEAWGFRPTQILVWVKPGLGAGHRFRTNHEYVVFGERGPRLPITVHDVGTWHLWQRNGHSVKPAAFGDLVERVSPGPYVELFARAQRLGWDSWGHGWEQVA